MDTEATEDAKSPGLEPARARAEAKESSHIPPKPPRAPDKRARVIDILRVARRRTTTGARRRASSERTIAAVAVRMARAGPGREERRRPRERLTANGRGRSSSAEGGVRLARRLTERQSHEVRQRPARIVHQMELGRAEQDEDLSRYSAVGFGELPTDKEKGERGNEG